LVLRLLARRLGTVDESIQEQVRQLSVPQLETLAEALLDFFSIADLQAWLAQQ
jgi:hypothetical protein